MGEHDVEARAAGMSAFGVIVASDEQSLARFVAVEDELDEEWRDAATIVGWNLSATAAQVSELADGVAELVDRLRTVPPTRGDARPVRVTLRILPQPTNRPADRAAEESPDAGGG